MRKRTKLRDGLISVDKDGQRICLGIVCAVLFKAAQQVRTTADVDGAHKGRDVVCAQQSLISVHQLGSRTRTDGSNEIPALMSTLQGRFIAHQKHGQRSVRK